MSDTFKIAGEMTIYTAAELKPLLVDHVRNAESPILDLAGVTDFDTAGLQLLLLARREGEAMGRRVRFEGHSGAVQNCLDILKLSASLEAH